MYTSFSLNFLLASKVVFDLDKNLGHLWRIKDKRAQRALERSSGTEDFFLTQQDLYSNMV